MSNAENAQDLYRLVSLRRNAFSELKHDANFDGLVFVAQGFYNEKEHDLISLSAQLNIPRTSCHRLIGTWLDLDFVTRNRENRRYLLSPTDALMTRFATLNESYKAS